MNNTWGGKRENCGRKKKIESKKKGYKVYLEDDLRERIILISHGKSFSEKIVNLIKKSLELIEKEKNEI